MKIIVLNILLLATLVLPVSGAKDSFYPETFASRQAAETAAHALFAGGDVDVLRVGNKEVLIFTVHGSGLPDIGIAAYLQKDGVWRFASAFRPSPNEFHKAKVRDSGIVIVGKHTKKEWSFLKVD